MLQNFDRVAESYDNVESDHLKILYYDLEKGYKDTYKSYGYYRLCTMFSGKKVVSINGENTFSYTPTEYVLLPPDSNVEFNIATHTKAVVYEINGHVIDKISQRMGQEFSSNDKIIKKSYSKELLNVLKSLNLNMYQKDKESRFFMDLHVQELVYRLMNDNKKDSLDGTYYNPAEIARDIIIKPGNEHLSIGEIAQMLRMSQSNLDYYFKKEFKTTPKRYQNQIKVERAKHLLKENNVTEVAMILGFDNISHFIGLFKMKYGLTPKQYIKQIK
ncbi:helix-turn-helix domain-containing protein [uncultured Ilyobacter sp.]|uniref:helix-turn-helix domain-containing protein n=1 Tax=uncultured Ilyobacter sp. TaxID=544433 RepID=UPI0029C04E54|nr:helix-turn-helix domain-containing protein [uncultured Ilyobacter sp.]